MTLAGKTAFVSGGSGFIGARLIEVLVREYGMRVKTLVRGSTSAGGGAFRAAAAGAEIVFGSLLDEAALDTAVAGADLVFHCAYGIHGSPAEQRRVTVEGTRLLARCAGRAGVGHFVHLGTVASYGGNTPPVVAEDFVDAKLWPWPYAHDKRDAEEALAQAAVAAGMPYTILRLGAVYGPYGGSFTVGPIQTLKLMRLALVDDGQGISNAVYVDDVIQAMLLSAQRGGTGERYTIRGPDDVTWRAFYEHYDRMVGKDSLVAVTRAEMRVARRNQWQGAVRALVPETLAALKASPGFRAAAGALPGLKPAYQRFGKRLVKPVAPGFARQQSDDRPLQLTPEIMVGYFANRSTFSIAKACSQLGYDPVYDLAKGMALTRQWAEWANLLPTARGDGPTLGRPWTDPGPTPD